MHFCCHNKNYYYFYKSNILVINWIWGSRNKVKDKKYEFIKKSDERRESFLPNTDNFLAFSTVFEWGRIFESAMDKSEKECNASLRRNYFPVNPSVLTVVFHWQIKKNRQFREKLSLFFSF